VQAKPISIQLYSLRERAEKDFPAVIRAVGAIGYSGVEPAGFHGLAPRELRRLVEAEGMVVSSSHGPWAAPDNLAQVIDTAGELGTTLVSSGFGPEAFADMAAIGRTADTVNAMDERLRAAGLTLFVHNHWWEFELRDGRLKHELFAELAPRVAFEIDTYWAANFGAVDPVAVVKRNSKRTPLLHLKDGPLVRDRPQLAVGTGKMDVAGVIAAADPSTLRWLVVELDSGATDMLEAVASSYDWLVATGLAAGRVQPREGR
jgi:sugar phosphate isomerase/epimerase